MSAIPPLAASGAIGEAAPVPRTYGLVAHRRHRTAHGSAHTCALAHWAHASEPAVRALQLRIAAVGGAADALERLGLLQTLSALHRLPYGHEGGLMKLVSRVAGGIRPEDELAGVVYLMDPLDPSSLYPEAQALKRQCITHRKPLLLTVAAAIEWMAVEWANAGGPALRGGAAGGIRPLAQQALALIAHDSMKARMVEFADQHFEVLSRTPVRYATGTTGRKLNELAWARGWPADTPWVHPFRSGPMGGDAQIAELVLDRRCQKVVFFEDVHVARQHEADIQLLERAVCSVGDEAACLHTFDMADAWAKAWR